LPTAGITPLGGVLSLNTTKSFDLDENLVVMPFGWQCYQDCHSSKDWQSSIITQMVSLPKILT